MARGRRVGSLGKKRTSAQEQTSIDLRSLADAVLKEWGGVSGLVRSMREDYEKAEPGSVARIRMGTTIMQFLQKVPPAPEIDESEASSLLSEAKALIRDLEMEK